MFVNGFDMWEILVNFMAKYLCNKMFESVDCLYFTTFIDF